MIGDRAIGGPSATASGYSAGTAAASAATDKPAGPSVSDTSAGSTAAATAAAGSDIGTFLTCAATAAAGSASQSAHVVIVAFIVSRARRTTGTSGGTRCSTNGVNRYTGLDKDTSASACGQTVSTRSTVGTGIVIIQKIVGFRGAIVGTAKGNFPARTRATVSALGSNTCTGSTAAASAISAIRDVGIVVITPSCGFTVGSIAAVRRFTAVSVQRTRADNLEVTARNDLNTCACTCRAACSSSVNVQCRACGNVDGYGAVLGNRKSAFSRSASQRKRCAGLYIILTCRQGLTRVCSRQLCARQSELRCVSSQDTHRHSTEYHGNHHTQNQKSR